MQLGKPGVLPILSALLIEHVQFRGSHAEHITRNRRSWNICHPSDGARIRRALFVDVVGLGYRLNNSAFGHYVLRAV